MSCSRASKQLSDPQLRQPSKPSKPNPNVVTPLRASQVVPTSSDVQLRRASFAAGNTGTDTQPRRSSFSGAGVKELTRRNSFGALDPTLPPRTISANRKEFIGFKPIEAALELNSGSPSKEVEVMHPAYVCLLHHRHLTP